MTTNNPITTRTIHPRPSTLDPRSAFTLIELLVVIVIIGVLAGLVLGISGLAQKKAARSRAISDLENIKQALEEYRVNHGSYPFASDPPQRFALTDGAINVALVRAKLTNYYADLTFTDPWGTSYLYSNTSTYAYRLWSEGPNVGSSYPEDDIDTRSGL